MSKEKQIEEMWNIVTTDCNEECVGCEYENDNWCFTHRVINNLYNAGYRKQEWISVEERLPQSEQMVLCYTPCDGFMFVGFYREVEPNPYWKSYWNIITAMRSTKKVTKKVTHWMPLPEPPKKGGGE